MTDDIKFQFGRKWSSWSAFEESFESLLKYVICSGRLTLEDAEHIVGKAFVDASIYFLEREADVDRLEFSSRVYYLCKASVQTTLAREATSFESLITILNPSATPISADGSADTLFSSRDTYSIVFSAIDSLPDEIREPFMLRYYAHLPSRDVGSMLGMARSTVSRRVTTARERIRGLLIQTDPPTAPPDETKLLDDISQALDRITNQTTAMASRASTLSRLVADYVYCAEISAAFDRLRIGSRTLAVSIGHLADRIEGTVSSMH